MKLDRSILSDFFIPPSSQRAEEKKSRRKETYLVPKIKITSTGKQKVFGYTYDLQCMHTVHEISTHVSVSVNTSFYHR